MKTAYYWLLGSFLTLGFILPAQALRDATGDRGIDVRRLHAPPYDLIGRKVGIGQVEIGRPLKLGLDKEASGQAFFPVEQVFFRDRPIGADLNVDSHASMVATVMISRDKQLTGVAPGAKLYSSAIGSLNRESQDRQCITAQHIAQQNEGDVRAINLSYGEPLNRDPRENPVLDGNALLTRCLDWSARVHNTLYAVAGNQGGGGISIPTDHYNGITVASSVRLGDQFRKLDFANLSALPEGIGRTVIQREINVNLRRSLGLVAPGNGLRLHDGSGATAVSGTSFASPQVVGVVAVLQEYGDRQIIAGQWSLNARQSEVMKAVLLNAADKQQDPGDGRYLGQSRTILSKRHQDWLHGDAANNPTIPLDIEMGAGQLNAWRAYQQFQGGQWGPGSVPPIGWDYREVNSQNYQDYLLGDALPAGKYMSVTLAWHRHVELQDLNGNGQFDIGETFRDQGLNNLDLYVLPAQSDNLADSVCRSVSEIDSVEHLFCPIPQAGNYKIRVVYHNQVNLPSQAYGLAWWTANASFNP